MSSTSKFDTPQWRILPPARSVSNASTVSPSGTDAAPMQEIEVDPLGAQPLEAALAGGDGAAARGVMRIDLGDDEHASRCPAIASPTTSSVPPSPYISAVSISVMPRSMPSRSAADFLRGAVLALAELPGALAECGHLRAVRQLPRSACAPPKPRMLLRQPQHAQEVAAPQCGDRGRVVAAPQQFGGEVRRSRRRCASR